MMREIVQIACLMALLVILLIAAISDIKRRRIPNILCISVAMLAIPYWLAADTNIAHRVFVQLLLCSIAALVLIFMFARGLLGGGDVKLIAALLIWLPPHMAISTIPLIAMAGGIVAVAMLAVTPLRRRKVAGAKVPYAVAIAAGCLPWALSSIATLSGRI